ncbi:protein YAE1 homolog [Rhinophrynus dorsalis]
MSWMRVALDRRQENGRDEDVFDEDADEMSFLQKEWMRSMEKRVKEGYVDGMDAGKENSLQSGFNLGYKIGVNLLMPCGELRGTLSALLTWCQLQKPVPAASAQLGRLLSTVCQCEEQIIKCLASIYQVPHSNALSNSVEDLDLGSHDHKQNDQCACAASEACCYTQSSPASLVLSCRTTQQLSDAVKQELRSILQETILLVEQMDISADLLCHLQKLEK